jgi:hypothetical protein
MMRTKAFAAFGALAMIAAVACTGDRAPVAPQAAVPAAETSLDATDLRAEIATVETTAIGQGTTLVRSQPLASDVTVSKIIGPGGGELEIPQAGLRVYVPRGALTRSTTITATALKGDMVAYEFGPHGTRFALPLVVTQRTEGTDAASLPAGSVLSLGYFTSPGQLDPVTRTASIAELISRLAFSTGDAVVFPVTHFSGYAVLWGVHNDR